MADMVIVLHMRNGDTISYSPTDDEVRHFTTVVDEHGFDGVLTINDGPVGQRLVNLAVIDWIEVKGVPDVAPTP